jgi:hypothetical protein
MLFRPFDLGTFKFRNNFCEKQFMQSPLIEAFPADTVAPLTTEEYHQEFQLVVAGESSVANQPTTAIAPAIFKSHFQGYMDLYAPVAEVTAYLDAHKDWFRRCAQPMKAEPIGEDGYILSIGRYGSFGYEVEPRIGLHLLPQSQGTYNIQTIDLPEHDPQQYQVDFQASMHLLETALPEDSEAFKLGIHHLTKIDWTLDLGVTIHFPKFIYRLPGKLIQGTGDRLLAEIVKQVSGRLMGKVQSDFHQSQNLNLPKRLLRHRSA